MSELSRQPAPREAGEIERALAAVVLGVICLITLANVVVRYFTNYSFAATEEISVVLMVVLALLGSATAVARRRHIAITILVERLPARLTPSWRSWSALCKPTAMRPSFGSECGPP